MSPATAGADPRSSRRYERRPLGTRPGSVTPMTRVPSAIIGTLTPRVQTVGDSPTPRTLSSRVNGSVHRPVRSPAAGSAEGCPGQLRCRAGCAVEPTERHSGVVCRSVGAREAPPPGVADSAGAARGGASGMVGAPLVDWSVPPRPATPMAVTRQRRKAVPQPATPACHGPPSAACSEPPARPSANSTADREPSPPDSLHRSRDGRPRTLSTPPETTEASTGSIPTRTDPCRPNRLRHRPARPRTVRSRVSRPVGGHASAARRRAAYDAASAASA